MDGLATGTDQLTGNIPPAELTLCRVRSVRAYFYRDPDSEMDIDGITCVQSLDGDRWIRTIAGDPVWHAQTGWYYDNSAGSDEATGLVGAPIKTISELYRRMIGCTATTAVTLHPAAALSDSESALFDAVQSLTPFRQWSLG